MTEREAAERLGITKTAAQHAAVLDRLMRRLGLTDPYVRLTQPPTDYPKAAALLPPAVWFDPLPVSASRSHYMSTRHLASKFCPVSSFGTGFFIWSTIAMLRRRTHAH